MEPSAAVVTCIHYNSVTMTEASEQLAVQGPEAGAVHALDMHVTYPAAGDGVHDIAVALHPALIKYAAF